MQSVKSRLRADSRSAGSASVELAITFPVVVALIFVTAQAGLYYYATSVALAAAQEGARAGSLPGATPAGARSEAETYLTGIAPDLLQAPAVRAQRTATSASVTVTGQSLSVVPGFAGFPVTQHASAPIERVT